MRNCDFLPSRFQAQFEAVNTVCNDKLQMNPENTIGLISMSNKEILCTLTNDTGLLYNRMHSVEPEGQISLVISYKIAHLALRHRQLRNQKMRIVSFVGSPVVDDSAAVSLSIKFTTFSHSVDKAG